MYDASKYADDRPSTSSNNSSAVELRLEVSPAGQFVTSPRHLWRRGRPLSVSSSMRNGFMVDAVPLPSAAGPAVVRNGRGGGTGGSRRAVNGLSSSSDSSQRNYSGPRLDVPGALTASLDDATLMSPDSVASTLSSPGDVRPSSDLLDPASGRCPLGSLADEYFPVTLGGGRRSTDPGQVPAASTSNGRHHRRRHSHHRRHRQQHNGQGHGQGHSQGHGRPSSGHSSSSSNSRSSVSHIYPAATSSNGTVVNGTLPHLTPYRDVVLKMKVSSTELVIKLLEFSFCITNCRLQVRLNFDQHCV